MNNEKNNLGDLKLEAGYEVIFVMVFIALIIIPITGYLLSLIPFLLSLILYFSTYFEESLIKNSLLPPLKISTVTTVLFTMSVWVLNVIHQNPNKIIFPLEDYIYNIHSYMKESFFFAPQFFISVFILSCLIQVFLEKIKIVSKVVYFISLIQRVNAVVIILSFFTFYSFIPMEIISIEREKYMKEIYIAEIKKNIEAKGKYLSVSYINNLKNKEDLIYYLKSTNVKCLKIENVYRKNSNELSKENIRKLVISMIDLDVKPIKKIKQYKYKKIPIEVLKKDTHKFNLMYKEIRKGIIQIISQSASLSISQSNDIVKLFVDNIIETISKNYFESISEKWIEKNSNISLLKYAKNKVISDNFSINIDRKKINMELNSIYQKFTSRDFSAFLRFEKSLAEYKRTTVKNSKFTWNQIKKILKKAKFK